VYLGLDEVFLPAVSNITTLDFQHLKSPDVGHNDPRYNPRGAFRSTPKLKPLIYHTKPSYRYVDNSYSRDETHDHDWQFPSLVLWDVSHTLVNPSIYLTGGISRQRHRRRFVLMHVGSLKYMRVLTPLSIPIVVLFGLRPQNASPMAQVLPYSLRSLCLTNHLFHFDSCGSEWPEEHFLFCLRDFL